MNTLLIKLKFDIIIKLATNIKIEILNDAFSMKISEMGN